MSAITPPAFYGPSRHAPAGASKQGRFFWEYARRAEPRQSAVTDACRNAPAFFEAKRAFLLRLALLQPAPIGKRTDHTPPPTTQAQTNPLQAKLVESPRCAA